MTDLKNLSLDDQVYRIIGEFFPDYREGRWYQVDFPFYRELRSDVEKRTRYLLHIGADPQILLDAYLEVASLEEVAVEGNILELARGISWVYQESIKRLHASFL